ncbi:MAG: NAD-glutamate dehydrogenase domain-containing protein [Sphingomicrobium sp.]
MTVHTRLDRPLVELIRKAMTANALPGEAEGLTPETEQEAAEFLAQVGAKRKPGEVALAIQSLGGEAGRRRMRIAIVNDDMPFLVDSVANCIASHQLTIHNLLHPVICVERDEAGLLEKVEPLCSDKSRRESLIYIELDRADSKERQTIARELREALGDVRAAVRDWPKLQVKMREDAAALTDPESSALLDWFAEGAMTLLGYHVERPGKVPTGGLGLFSRPGEPTDPGGCRNAMKYLEQIGQVPLMAKAERRSTVHRRVPLDLVVLPVRDKGKITGIGVHAGLWTSEALKLPPQEVPVLRRRLLQLDEDFGFDPKGHSGKALRHAVASLPRDLMISLPIASVRELVVMAMSLADRPRPALIQVRSVLRGLLFSFVWLPREELTTQRRLAISELLEDKVDAPVTNWSVELGDGDLALIRYAQFVDNDAPMPDANELDNAVVEMVRGWDPAVEGELIKAAGASRATRLALTYIGTFPDEYTARTSPAEGAADILRLCAINEQCDRDVRICYSGVEGDRTLRLKTYRIAGVMALSEVVPVLENFGLRVLEELPTALANGGGYIHDFTVEIGAEADMAAITGRTADIERAIANVLCGRAEDDEFNQLVLYAGLEPRAVVWLRAWFRYLRQTGSSFGLLTVVDALRRAPDATRALIGLFAAAHDPANGKHSADKYRTALTASLVKVTSIDDDRILRRLFSVIDAIVRTNAFAPAATEALAFKINSSLVPGLPRPVPWREIWVYSPRVEGIHLRGGPVARGGLRWSDRRDDFRTEILGLMKAQLVKNAVIVPTGAKGGFYPKQLPNAATDREAWLAEGTESYRIFIRSLLSVTDNLSNDKVVHPDKVVIQDDDDPYFVVAADKGTATFSDIANGIALERNFWLGDAFASGGSNGYDHKAMGITAKGAWISVQRHFIEMGVDVQSETVTVAGCGDMSGDVFGNGMLLSKAIKLVAAYDHRHIFLDPNPDPRKSWIERDRMFKLPRSSWADYNRKLISKGGGAFPRSEKMIPLSSEVRAMLGTEEKELDPTSLINLILKSAVDLIWFGGIGTYIKASSQGQSDVGDPSNDMLRVSADELRCKVIGEGANLAITQAGRIEFARRGGRINTDFIDNSAGVDCSDNEVNIKIPLNREMVEGDLSLAKRNILLAQMTDEVSELVLEDNRLQTLALSIAQAGGHVALPGHVRTLEMLEAMGRLDRRVEGLQASDELLRRGQDHRGLTRPELSVLLSLSKIALQDAIEGLKLADDPVVAPQLFEAFPVPMRKGHAEAIRAHRLRHEILATKVANRLVNRLGPNVAYGLTEEEGCSLGQAAASFLVAEQLLDLPHLWAMIESADVTETVRIELFAIAASSVRNHLSDIIRAAAGETSVTAMVELFDSGVKKIASAATRLLRAEVKNEAEARYDRLVALGASDEIVRALVRLYELDGAFGLAALAKGKNIDQLQLAKAYTQLGEALGLDWAQQQVVRFVPADQWERLLVAGLARDFEQLRIEFLSRIRGEADVEVEAWIQSHGPRIAQFRQLIDRARREGNVSVSMLAQVASQARILLGR